MILNLCDRFGYDYGTYSEFKDSDYAYLFLKRSLCSMDIIVDGKAPIEDYDSARLL